MVGVFIESEDSKIKKTSIEAICYARDFAQSISAELVGFIFNNKNDNLFNEVAEYGLKKIYCLNNENEGFIDNQIQAKILALQLAQKNIHHIVFSGTVHGKVLAARTTIRCNLNAQTNKFSIINNPTALMVNNKFIRPVYSGKAFENLTSNSVANTFIINPNSYSISPSKVTHEQEEIKFNETSTSTKLINKIKTSDKISLTEATVVVSGGRGLKGPENWGMIEELAQLLNAATACSRPVADLHWRPHHEHVGQTGIQINPNFYIAIGISGAIQHLAGVNRSKFILVINIDPDAPFIKAADFAVIGDCFSVVPKLISAIKSKL